jgi:hypothetical protein
MQSIAEAPVRRSSPSSEGFIVDRSLFEGAREMIEHQQSCVTIREETAGNGTGTGLCERVFRENVEFVGVAA